MNRGSYSAFSSSLDPSQVRIPSSPANFGPPISFRASYHVNHKPYNMDNRSRLVPPPPLPLNQSMRGSQVPVQGAGATATPSRYAPATQVPEEYVGAQYATQGQYPAPTPGRAYQPAEESFHTSLLRTTNNNESTYNAISDTVRVLSEQIDTIRQGTNERFRKLYVGIEQLEQRLSNDESLFKLAEDLADLQKEQKDAAERGINPAYETRLRDLEDRMDGFDAKMKVLDRRVVSVVDGMENMAAGIEKRLEEEHIMSEKRIEEIKEQAAMHVEAARKQMDTRMSALEDKFAEEIKRNNDKTIEELKVDTSANYEVFEGRLDELESKLSHEVGAMQVDIASTRSTHEQHQKDHDTLQNRFMELLRFLDSRHARADEQGATLRSLEGEVTRLSASVQRYRILMAKLIEQASDTVLETDEVDEGALGGPDSPAARRFADGVAQVANALIESTTGNHVYVGNE